MKLNYDKCKHCKYFYQHYGINIDHIHKIYCRHCTKHPNPDRFGFYSGKQPCPYFEQNKAQDTKHQKQNLEYLLTNISNNIEYIKLFLNKNKPKQEISDVVIDKLNKQN